MYPLGYVERVVRSGKSFESSQRIINLMHQIPTRPSSDAREAVAGLDSNSTIDEDADTDIEDLHDLLVVTIDSESCKDADDGLSIRRLPTGGFVVGVHITDVARFVQKGDVVDKNAGRRVTSFYSSTRKVYHMLPAKLSEDVCSLMEDQVRHVISVYISTDWLLNVIDADCAVKRSVVRNLKNVTYEKAQQMIDASKNAEPSWIGGSLESVIVHLHKIADRMRNGRMKEGEFFSEAEDPFATVDQLVHREAHRLVEEFMIMANAKIARLIVDWYPESAPVRRQKEPTFENMESWWPKWTDTANSSFYFRQFEMLRKNFGSVDINDDRTVAVLESTIRAMESFGKPGGGDWATFAAVIGCEKRHPMHALAMKNWYQIQVAEFV